MSGQNAIDDFKGALEAFKQATRDLSRAWSEGDLPLDILGDSYPSWPSRIEGVDVVSLPSFDEFALLVEHMEVVEPSPEMDVQVPLRGQRVICRRTFLPATAVAVHAEELGTIVRAENDSIEVMLDRHHPDLNTWNNCVLFDAISAGLSESQMDSMTPMEAAAAVFNSHFLVIA